ncbi:MAG TPA: fumarate hydratase [Candidatus Korarchaeota archaeon]|nr:fumarate hydratase [Candidatus Korarchaeota archaeon]
MAEYRLRTPISEDEARKLRAGDVIYISGVVVTARDQAHRRALELARRGEKPPIDLEGGVVYHCGPIVRQEGGEWKIYGFGPTTSARMEPLEPEFIEKFRVRVIVGKGGMFERTTEALKRFGAVYAQHPGGASALAVSSVKRVLGVHWLDLGMPEAVWVVEVEDLGPLTVTIDSTGRNLYLEVLEAARARAGKK